MLVLLANGGDFLEEPLVQSDRVQAQQAELLVRDLGDGLDVENWVNVLVNLAN